MNKRQQKKRLNIKTNVDVSAVNLQITSIEQQIKVITDTVLDINHTNDLIKIKVFLAVLGKQLEILGDNVKLVKEVIKNG